MKRRMLAVCALACFSVVARADVMPGQNVLVNGDAETGTTSGWTGNFTTVAYGATGGFPTATDHGPADRGQYFFAGGPGMEYASGTQRVNVSNLGSTIDDGDVSYTFSGYFGGFSSQRDYSNLRLDFLNDANDVLGYDVMGGFTSANRGDMTGLFEWDTKGQLPAGTRNLLFTLSMTRVDGSYNDGYADNLSFVLDTPAPPPATGVTPEPSSVWLLVSDGLGVMGERLRRRRLRVQR